MMYRIHILWYLHRHHRESESREENHEGMTAASNNPSRCDLVKRMIRRPPCIAISSKDRADHGEFRRLQTQAVSAKPACRASCSLQGQSVEPVCGALKLAGSWCSALSGLSERQKTVWRQSIQREKEETAGSCMYSVQGSCFLYFISSKRNPLYTFQAFLASRTVMIAAFVFPRYTYI